MANLDTLSDGELYNEIAELARAQGVATQEDWNNLVEEVIESHFDIGELNDDQDLEGKRSALNGMWSTYRSTAGEETPTQIDQDPEEAHL